MARTVLAVLCLYARLRLLRGVKVALAFHGKMGIWEGRHAKGATGGAGRFSPFDVALHCIRRNILDANVPDQEVYTFVHTWDTVILTPPRAQKEGIDRTQRLLNGR